MDEITYDIDGRMALFEKFFRDEADGLVDRI
jgi:hypothetical protein